MPATKIMVMRHAEKPDDGGPLGITEAGDEDKESLVVRGWQRAGALAVFFSPLNSDLAALGLVMPDLVFASDDQKRPAPPGSKGELGSHSKRPVETVTPLAAKRLGREPDTTYCKGQAAALAAAAMAADGHVLICWQHEEIPDIANQIVPPPNAIPQTWPEDRYDVIWVFDPPGAPGQPWSFAQVPQRLLPGDSDEPIPVG